MEYSVFTHSSGEPLDTVDMHVLARAYRAAWRTIFARNPVGAHVIAALDVMFVFPAKDQHPDADVGHYVQDRHIPEQEMTFGGALVGEEDIPSARLAQLAAGAPPTAQEKLLWRRRWTQHALSEPVEFELPLYNIGTIRARTGERACWLATIDGGADAYLGIELFGFACSVEEIFARFRATVVAATLPFEIGLALRR